MSPHLLRAWRLTDTGLAECRSGSDGVRQTRRLPGVRTRSATLLTAWNPRSRRRPDGWNQRMHNSCASVFEGLRLRRPRAHCTAGVRRCCWSVAILGRCAGLLRCSGRLELSNCAAVRGRSCEFSTMRWASLRLTHPTRLRAVGWVERQRYPSAVGFDGQAVPPGPAGSSSRSGTISCPLVSGHASSEPM